MPRYYFLTNSTQTFIVGPFITVCDDTNRYFGQVIRSNDYSEQYDLKTLYKYKLWVFEDSESTNLSLLQIKYKLVDSLENLSLFCKLIGTFEGQIELLNPILEITDANTKYILELKISNGIICCPKLTIEF